MEILSVFCQIDDFCKVFEPRFHQMLLASGEKKRNRPPKMSLSEVMTILVMFHSSGYRNLKTFYLEKVCQQWQTEFPKRLSYNRFVERQRDAMMALWCYLHWRRASNTGITFVDSTPLRVCANLRIPRHKVFLGSAGRGKTSMGWFYGFKLPLMTNDCGEIVSCYVTAGNVDDRKPVPLMVEKAREIFGKLFADKGYISKDLLEHLQGLGVSLITPIRKNMKNKLMNLYDKLMLRKRSLIETINDQLKNISNIEHSRHRSLWNFLTNVAAGLIAYSFREKKPSLNLNHSKKLEPTFF